MNKCMTIDELRIEADKLGYNLVKKKSYMPIKPCPICGRKKTSTTRKQNILGILEDNKGGLTAEEIANELFERGNVPYVDKKFVSPRLTEMLHSGEVNVCGSHLSPITNRNTAVWKATNA